MLLGRLHSFTPARGSTMPYYTALPTGFITLDVDGDPVVDTNTNYLLNTFGNSDEFDDYDVPGDQGTGVTVNQGDPLTLVDSDGTDGGTDPSQANVPGTYLGDVVLANLNPIVLAGITVTLDPVQGDLIQGDNGVFYMVTDEPLVQNGIASPQLGLTVRIPGVPPLTPPQTLNLDLGALSGNPLTAGIAAGVQTALNTAIITLDADGTGTITVDDALPCFTAGTMIATADGPRAVDELKAGDMVVTKDRGLQPIRWIGSRKLTTRMLAANPGIRPIRIAAGALGHGKPERELLVSPQHRILVNSKIAINMFGTSEVLVAAKQLLSLDGVDYATDLQEVEYVHFMFDTHEVVVSNGAESESLYAGPQALKSLDTNALRELVAIFPELGQHTLQRRPAGARRLLTGREGRKLAQRHATKKRELLELQP
ncbi:Hint domain-containing protein [Paracoccus sp. TK19116]|uniref:Hint domain-containing protein n=1 Tax=Paracoccus albicereus TaxID=2922394 RepID=A0ABT1MNL2_9RHOB|nr:Hint domain-containing protein [Paracoccus albicereus]MCQ0969878.1 Hint domain-containing protein [Paracoccus albicereus]